MSDEQEQQEQFIKKIQELMGGNVISTRQAQFLTHIRPGVHGWFDGTGDPTRSYDFVEGEEVSLMQGSRQVCPECRVVAPIVITCAHANKIWVTPKWRAPKKTNDRAWKRIAEGDVLWDHGAIEAKARRDAERSASAAELMRKKKMTRSSAMREARYNIKTR